MGHHGGHFAKVLDHLLGGGQAEAVRLIVRHAALDSQHGSHLVHGRGQLTRHRHHPKAI